MTKVAASKERVNCPVYEKIDLSKGHQKVLLARKELMIKRYISFVGSQNLVTLIFTKRFFVNAGIPNAWHTFCQILVALDQLEPP